MQIGRSAKRPARAEAHAQLLAGVGEAPVLMAREDAARALGGLHISTIGKLARAGKLERVFIGRRSMVTVASVHVLIAAGARSGQQIGERLPSRLETAP
jgi:hypothetical protein